MRRKLLIALLAFGTVAGYGSAFMHRREHRARFEQHVADVCLDAARRAGPTALPTKPGR